MRTVSTKEATTVPARKYLPIGIFLKVSAVYQTGGAGAPASTPIVHVYGGGRYPAGRRPPLPHMTPHLESSRSLCEPAPDCLSPRNTVIPHQVASIFPLPISQKVFRPHPRLRYLAFLCFFRSLTCSGFLFMVWVYRPALLVLRVFPLL